jgi:xanthine dehydrogenase accessory factor
MEEVIGDIQRWQQAGEQIALATVVQTWGSAPRRPGAKMAITANGQLSGSVSGGCVEGAVAEEAFGVLATATPKLLHYGVADETGWEVGLACGGTIEIFVERVDDELLQRITNIINGERAAALVTVIAGPASLLGRKLLVETGQMAWGTIDPTLDTQVVEVATAALRRGHDQRLRLDAPTTVEEIELFIDLLLPPPTLVMVGGVHIAITLASLAKTMNYRTVVIDPRHAFGSDERFPHADQLLRSWPDEAFAHLKLTANSAVAILTHDPKIDDPALQLVLRSPAFYIGALGSRKTHAKRLDRLHAAGFTPSEVERIYAPIGLDIDAQTPEEIALAVMAQIVKARNALAHPVTPTVAHSAPLAAPHTS